MDGPRRLCGFSVKSLLRAARGFRFRRWTTGARAWYLAGGVACATLGAAAFLVRAILEMEGPPAQAVG